MFSRKFSFVYTLFGLLGLALLFLNNSGGVAAVQGQDRTGSPLSSAACNACHSGGSFSTSASLSITDGQGNTVSSYIPGETYELTYTINASGAAAYGMQAVALQSGNANAGSLSAPSSNAQISNLSGRQYLEQSGASNSNSFSATWTAPAVGSGTVNFYGSALALNGNGTSSGDQYVSIPTVTLAEAPSSSNVERNSLISAQLLPNRVQERLRLRLSLSEAQDLQMRVIDLQGRLWRSESLGTVQGALDQEWSVSDLPQGWYQLQLYGAEGQQSLRFFKY